MYEYDENADYTGKLQQIVDRIRGEHNLPKSEESKIESKVITAHLSLSGRFGIGHMADLPPKTQAALVHIVYDIGIPGLLKMEKLVECLFEWETKNEEAADDLMRSEYAKQLPERAKINAELIRAGGLSALCRVDDEENLF